MAGTEKARLWACVRGLICDRVHWLDPRWHSAGAPLGANRCVRLEV